jgi:hypothetical protein
LLGLRHERFKGALLASAGGQQRRNSIGREELRTHPFSSLSVVAAILPATDYHRAPYACHHGLSSTELSDME